MTQNKKDNIIIIVAVALLIGAFALAVVGFFTPPEGEISDSVLWFFAQCLVFTGSIFGINVYVKTKLSDITTNIADSISKHGCKYQCESRGSDFVSCDEP